MTDEMPVHIGSDRQLFLDDFMIAQSKGVSRRLHSPQPREVVLGMERPWEGQCSWSCVVLRDGDLYRMWYRVEPQEDLEERWDGTAYAESRDGVSWTRPDLGLHDFGGSGMNNIVWMGPGSNMSVFRDERPNVPSDQRYKAIVRAGGIFGLASADGIRWRLIREKPILTGGAFDSHNIVFQDPWTQQYMYYGRGFAETKEGRIRRIRHARSDDFINWTPLKFVEMDGPVDHLYTNAATPYRRARGTYLMFPKRFVPDRTFNKNWPYEGQSDIVFASSRDGIHWDRSFLEAFLRPGLDARNWHERAITMGSGIVQTAATELSMYYFENYRTDTCRIRRCTIRPDGFVSVSANYEGGEFTTRPLTFEGNELELNYSTSAVGYVRVEIQRMDGSPVPGHSLKDCPEIFGDEIGRTVRWNGGDLNGLASRPVRLRFVMKDADLFAFHFRKV